LGNINALVLVAMKSAQNPSWGLERLVRDEVCQHCDAVPSAGDFCSDRLARTCPLSVQLADIVAVLESLLSKKCA
jgi:hypothetical protein